MHEQGFKQASLQPNFFYLFFSREFPLSLQLLLDSADPKAWNKWLPTGIFRGITTNPTLLKVASQPCNIKNIKVLAELAQSLNCKDLHLQAWGNTYEQLIECGTKLGKLSTKELNIHVKVPLTQAGVKAARILIHEKNLSITFTACYEVQQVLIADSIGANYIAPYLGRIKDLGNDGLADIVKMQKSLVSIDSNCQVLVASIRKKNEIIKLIEEGIQTFTISEKLSNKLFNIKNTNFASINFEKDAKTNL